MMEKCQNTHGGNIGGCWVTTKKVLRTLVRAEKTLRDVQKNSKDDKDGKKTSKRCREM